MKSDPIKCILISKYISLQEKTGRAEFLFSGKYFSDIYTHLSKLNLDVGSALEITVDKVNTSKSVAQNNTFHDLLMIYWKSGYPSDLSYADLKIRIKDTYGCRHEIREIAGEQWKVLKSWSKYTLREGRQAIDGLISEMQMIGVNDKRFQEMVLKWNEFKKENSKPIEADDKIDLF